ncbi:MAG: hypothetical protein ACLFTH_03810 [Candidatus Woesearchaeota archaeon]
MRGLIGNFDYFVGRHKACEMHRNEDDESLWDKGVLDMHTYFFKPTEGLEELARIMKGLHQHNKTILLYMQPPDQKKHKSERQFEINRLLQQHFGVSYIMRNSRCEHDPGFGYSHSRFRPMTLPEIHELQKHYDHLVPNNKESKPFVETYHNQLLTVPEHHWSEELNIVKIDQDDFLPYQNRF